MARNNTPSFVLNCKILADDGEKKFLSKKMDMVNRIYNVGVKYYRKQVEALREDVWFQYSLEQWKKTEPDTSERKFWSTEISACITNYRLNEYDIHSFFGQLKVRGYEKGIGINIVQKVGSALHKSIEKAIFSGTEIHYRKYGTTRSFEDKKSDSGIILRREKWTVTIMGHTMRLRPIRKKDYYMQEALKHRVKFCRVVRNPSKTGYDYYLQIVLEGTPPKKVKRGSGTCGVDEGVSTVAYDNDDEADFVVLADGIEKYDREIRDAAVVYERRLRMANPECFNDDGTRKKGAKFTKRTKNAIKALFHLKNAYRRRSASIREKHGHLANRIVSHCYEIVKEPMNFRALQKRSRSKTERQDKVSEVKQKDGTVKKIRKFKRKKRFGKSINHRAPGLFNLLLEQKAKQYEVEVTEIDIQKYKASQYDHVTDSYKKKGLSERGSRIGGKRVQRDLYSSFLLRNYKDAEHPDRDKCISDFKPFLKRQGNVVNRMLKTGDTTRNFGLALFVA